MFAIIDLFWNKLFLWFCFIDLLRVGTMTWFGICMDPDQPAHPRSLIRIHAVRLLTLLQVEKLTANSMDPDQTARMLDPCW
jgi:hypothetical protein